MTCKMLSTSQFHLLSRCLSVGSIRWFTPRFISIFNETRSIADNYTTKQKYINRRYALEPPEVVNRTYEWSQAIAAGKMNTHELQHMADKYAFDHHCGFIIDSIDLLSDLNVIQILQSLLSSGISPETKVIRYLENGILWRVKNMNLNLALKCLSFHLRYQETEQQKQVVQALIVHCQSNMDQAKDINDVLQILKLAKCFSIDTMSRIEETAIQLITELQFSTPKQFTFNFDSLCYLLVLLAQAKRRPTPLIRAAANKLIEYPIEEINGKSLPPAHIIQMICALNALSFPDNNLLQKSADILCNKDFLSTIPSSAKRDLLVAVSQLNWSYPRLMDAFIEKITDDPNSFSTQDVVAFLLASARLYYRSPYLQEILPNYVLPKLKQNELEPAQWLNVVWSLAILGHATTKHVKSVFDDQFCNQLLKDLNIFEAQLMMIKLLNIFGVAQLELIMNLDPIIDLPKCLQDLNQIELPKRAAQLEVYQKSMIESLGTFIPKDKYMVNNIKTPFGTCIDAEFIMNASCKPLPLTEFGISGGEIDADIKPLPNGFKRIALMVVRFNESLISSSGLIGVHELTIRLLERIGYTPVVIQESDISVKATAIKKIQYLQKAIVSAIKDG